MSTAVPVLPPPLREGDRLSREEFLRRWEAMPDLKRAELINGVVHMPSPVSYPHNRIHHMFSGWLGLYEEETPSCEGGSAGTWLMGPLDAPQPDLTLRVRGGQSSVVKDYLAGAPELVVEVSHSSAARDLGLKADLYQKYGVQEYLIALTKKKSIVWRELVSGRYRRIQAREDGVFCSRVFPGLWLNPSALWSDDLKALLNTLRQGIASRS